MKLLWFICAFSTLPILWISYPISAAPVSGEEIKYRGKTVFVIDGKLTAFSLTRRLVVVIRWSGKITSHDTRIWGRLFLCDCNYYQPFKLWEGSTGHTATRLTGAANLQTNHKANVISVLAASETGGGAASGGKEGATSSPVSSQGLTP